MLQFTSVLCKQVYSSRLIFPRAKESGFGFCFFLHVVTDNQTRILQRKNKEEGYYALTYTGSLLLTHFSVVPHEASLLGLDEKTESMGEAGDL